jgi:hypothetical protein
MAEGRNERLAPMARELVDLTVDLIFASRRTQSSRGRGRHRRSRSCSYRWPTRCAPDSLSASRTRDTTSPASAIGLVTLRQAARTVQADGPQPNSHGRPCDRKRPPIASLSCHGFRQMQPTTSAGIGTE